MKILHVIPSMSPRRGGPSTAIGPMVRELQRIGVESAIVSTNDDGPDISDIPTWKWIEENGVRKYFLPRFSPPIRTVREFAIAPGFAAWARRTFPEFDAVHVHALFSYLPSRAMTICRALRIPYILRPLGLLEDWSMRRHSLRKKLFLSLFDAANLRGAAAIHFTSERERDHSHLAAGRPGFVVPLGVDEPHSRPDRRAARGKLGIGEDQCALLYLSRWHPKKRIEDLIDALSQVGERNWVLILAGNGEPAYEASVRSAVERAGLTAQVRTPGFLTGAEREDAFAAADAFVLPSHSENFGLAVAEAMIRGVPPVVSRDVAIAADIAESDAGWVIDDVRRDLPAVLTEVVLDTEGRTRRGLAAEEVARTRYCWTACARRLEQQYGQILGSGPTQ